MTDTTARPRPAFLDGPMRLAIGGQRISTGQTIATLDPATGQTLAEVPAATPAEVDLAVRAAPAPFPAGGTWPRPSGPGCCGRWPT